VAGRDNDVTAWMPLYVRDLLAATEDLGAHDFGATSGCCATCG
jgi:hypothetical protein